MAISHEAAPKKINLLAQLELMRLAATQQEWSRLPQLDFTFRKMVETFFAQTPITELEAKDLYNALQKQLEEIQSLIIRAQHELVYQQKQEERNLKAMHSYLEN